MRAQRAMMAAELRLAHHGRGWREGRLANTQFRLTSASALAFAQSRESGCLRSLRRGRDQHRAGDRLRAETIAQAQGEDGSLLDRAVAAVKGSGDELRSASWPPRRAHRGPPPLSAWLATRNSRGGF